jgi:hypothetical protein
MTAMTLQYVDMEKLMIIDGKDYIQVIISKILTGYIYLSSDISIPRHITTESIPRPRNR